MADDDALSSLKNRLQKSGLDSQSSAPRRSRASRTPIDTTPDTFMGASVGAKSSDEDAILAASAEPPGTVNLADDDSGDEGNPRKRRPRQRTGKTRVTEAVDPDLMTQLLSGLNVVPSSVPAPTVTEDPEAEKRKGSIIERIVPISEPPKEDSKSDSETETETESESEPEPEPESNPGVESESRLVGANPELKAQSNPESKPQSNPELKPQSTPELKTQSTPELKPQSTPELKPQSNPELRPEPNLEPPKEVSKPIGPTTTTVSKVPHTITQSDLNKLKREIILIRKKHENADERLEDYDALCEKLVPDAESGARALARYIGPLLQKEEELDDLRPIHNSLLKSLEVTKKELVEANEKISTLEMDLETVKAEAVNAKSIVSALENDLKNARDEIAAQKSAHVELEQIIESNNSKKSLPPNSPPDVGQIQKLEELLSAKDSEIAELKAQLDSVKASNSILLPEDLETLPLGEEDAIIAMAEEELKLMEDLIKEQEAYIANLEKELGDEGIGIGTGMEPFEIRKTAKAITND